MNHKACTLTMMSETDHSEVDGIRRLRLALKRMLRSLGIRCLEFGEVEPHEEIVL